MKSLLSGLLKMASVSIRLLVVNEQEEPSNLSASLQDFTRILCFNFKCFIKVLVLDPDILRTAEQILHFPSS